MKTLLHIGTATRLNLPPQAWDVAHLPPSEAGGPWPVEPDIVVVDAPPDQSLLVRCRLEHPVVPRVVLTASGDTYDGDVARHTYAYTTVSRDPVRLDWLLREALGESALPRTPSRIDVAELPVLPANATRLLAALDDPEVRLQEATRLIEADPGLAARVLTLANSAFYGLPRRVSRLQDAAGFLGLATLRRTVLATQVFRAFETIEDQDYVQKMRDFSVLRMNLARRIVGVPNEELATAALLMDVGRLAQRCIGNDPAESLFPLSDELDAEAERSGLDSGLLGAMILDDWGMPRPIVRAVASAWWAWPHPSAGMSTATVLRIASALAAEGLGEPADLPSEWLEALGVQNKVDGWREQAADLAIQWPAA